MNKVKWKFKKGTAILLTFVLLAGILPIMPSDISKVSAADENSGSTPSVTAYATKDELMNTFQQDGTNTTIGKVVFGKDYNGNPLEWYILGKDAGVVDNEGKSENIAVFVTSPIATGQAFNSSSNSTNFDYDGTGTGTEVYASHYGASELREALQNLATNESYFTTAEQSLMQATAVKTTDMKNNIDYTTTDVLYALKGNSLDDKKIFAGSSDDKVLEVDTYWSIGNLFWLRIPSSEVYVYTAGDTFYSVIAAGVDLTLDLRPASNLNLSSVIFASAVTSATSDTAVTGTISEGTAMTLRLDGSSKDLGSVMYYDKYGMIFAERSAAAKGTVSLVVQGNDGANDWYYSKVVSGSEVLSASDIKTELGLSADIDLDNCKIWIETTENSLIYAVEAAKGDVEFTPSVTAYATKNELMNTFQQDGTNTIIGKVVFGKDYNGNPMEWYILGKDTGVVDSEGKSENIAIFTTSPIATGQAFNSSKNNINFDYDGTGTGTEVYANHYGASELREALQNLATNESYFTTAEQNLMQATAVKTTDTKNNIDYTTTDVLYALKGNSLDDKKIFAGSSDDKVLEVDTYWSSGSKFSLRSPLDIWNIAVLSAAPGEHVTLDFANSVAIDLRSASNLNLSSVIFSSAAKTATSEAVESGTIPESTAMILRLDGSSKDLGRVVYDSTQGIILAEKSDTAGTVAVVVQGNDGTNDWYYSKVVSDSEVLSASDIKTELGLSADIDLDNCKIWLETTDTDGLIYADTELTEGTIITSIALETTAPVKDTALDTTAVTTTVGLSEFEPTVTWKAGDTPVTGNAGYNTEYTAYVILDVVDTTYFATDVTATINGNTATVTANADGTITVSYTFPATEKGIISHTAAGYNGTYDGESHSIAVSVTNPSDVKISYSTDKGETKSYSEENPVFTEAGEYTVYYKIEKDNYETVYGSKTANISRKELSITASDQTITYGDSIDKTEYSVTGLLTGHSINEVTLTPSTGNVTDNGSITVSIDKIEDVSGEEVTANYNVICTSGKLVIGKAVMDHTATGYNGTYDGESHGIAVSVTNPSDVKISYSTDKGEAKSYSEANPVFTEAGEYTVYYKIEKDNYETVYGSKTVNISRKELSITASDQTIIYGDSIDKTEYSVTGLLTGHSINEVTLTPSTENVTDNGSITVSIDKISDTSGGEVTANYNVVCTSGKLVIENAVMDHTATGYNGTYDGESHSIAVSVTNPSDVKISYSTDKGETRSYSEENPAFTEAGEYTVYYKIEKDNYETVYGSKTVNISRKELSITASDQTITYGDSLDKTEYSVTGLLTGHSINEVTLTPSTENVTDNGSITVSIDKIEDVSGEEVTANYNVICMSGKLVIESKEEETVVYEIIDGMNSEWTVGDEGSITITGNGAYEDFVGVKVDGEFIDDESYTVESGSTIVTLKNFYLNTLTAGTHTFEMVWTDGSARTSFTVKDVEDTKPSEPEKPATEVTKPSEPEKPTTEVTKPAESEKPTTEVTKADEPENPETGDNSHLYVWLILLIVSCFTITGFYGKKKYTAKK